MAIVSFYVILSWQVRSHIFRVIMDIITLSHCCHIFPWLCVWVGCMLSVSYISRESWVFVFLLLSSLMMCTNNRMHCGSMVVLVCLSITVPHYHNYADLSEGIELLKCFSDAFCFDGVSKIKAIVSVIFHTILYGVAFIQFTHYSYGESYYHHQIGSMTHLPLFMG